MALDTFGGTLAITISSKKWRLRVEAYSIIDAFCFPWWHPCLPEEVKDFICEYSKSWSPRPSPVFAAHWFLLCMKVCPSPRELWQLRSKTVFTRKPTVTLQPPHSSLCCCLTACLVVLLFFREGWIPKAETCCSISISFSWCLSCAISSFSHWNSQAQDACFTDEENETPWG